MFKIIAVTNRRLCTTNFLERLEALAAAGVSAVILREKDLPPEQYLTLARQAVDVCKKYGVPLIPHGNTERAKQLDCPKVHLPFSVFMSAIEDDIRSLKVGVSVHSLEDARYATARGAAYLIAGHIFQTPCKSGLAPRGIGFLVELCGAVSIPVYGIGGIMEQHLPALRDAGAAGACLMSSLMECADPGDYLERLYQAVQDTK